MDFNQKNNVYYTDHVINKTISLALAPGFGAKMVPPVAKLRGNSIFYGILRGTGDIMKEAIADGTDYLYCDHSFFGDTRSDVRYGNYSGYFRLIQNGRYRNPFHGCPRDRWDRLGINVRPWSKSGEHIVVVPLSGYVAEFNGVDAKAWLANTIKAISELSDRDIVIKPKDGDQPLSEVLNGAQALVTLDSNAAVDAAILGIPVFTSLQNAASPVANHVLNDLDNPKTPDRDQWLFDLAYQQFTLDEIEHGHARYILEKANNEYFADPQTVSATEVSITMEINHEVRS